jgi:hypothetical protein
MNSDEIANLVRRLQTRGKSMDYWFKPELSIEYEAADAIARLTRENAEWKGKCEVIEHEYQVLWTDREAARRENARERVVEECLAKLEPLIYQARCVTDGISSELRTLWRARDVIHSLVKPISPSPQEPQSLETAKEIEQLFERKWIGGPLQRRAAIQALIDANKSDRIKHLGELLTDARRENAAPAKAGGCGKACATLIEQRANKLQTGDPCWALLLAIAEEIRALASPDDGWVKVDEGHPLPDDLGSDDMIRIEARRGNSRGSAGVVAYRLTYVTADQIPASPEARAE